MKVLIMYNFQWVRVKISSNLFPKDGLLLLLVQTPEFSPFYHSLFLYRVSNQTVCFTTYLSSQRTLYRLRLFYLALMDRHVK